MNARLLPAILCLFGAACAEGEGVSPGAASVFDSAGARIVESTTPVWGEGEAWQLVGSPGTELEFAL